MFFRRTRPMCNASSRGAATRKPQLEVLEDRCLLAGMLFDAAADFSSANNPTGSWSYGSSTSLGGPVSRYVDSRNISGIDFWRNDVVRNTASVAHNGTSGTVVIDDQTWAAGELSSHPGINGEYSLVRWTSPYAGTISITVRFSRVNFLATTDVHVLKNGIALFNGYVDNGTPTTSFSTQSNVLVAARDTIDFAVGFGRNGNWVSDQTGIAAQIKLDAPDIAVLDATTADLQGFQTIELKYSVSHADVPTSFTFHAYLSADEKYNPGKDVKPLGELTVGPSDAMAGPGGVAKEYSKTPTLTQPIALTFSRRFILVVADDDQTVSESDETNNAAFVIPLFQEGQRGGFARSSGAWGTSVKEVNASDPIQGRISRGTTDFDRLGNLTSIWQSIGGSFKDEEPTPYLGDDHRINSDLLPSVSQFTNLIQEARKQGGLNDGALVITEAFDEEGEHSRNALHYEGRAIDIAASDTILRPLTGLALLAGFDWVYYEVIRDPKSHSHVSHLHVSHTGAHAEVFTTALAAALDFGFRNQLITSRPLYEALKQTIMTVQMLTQQIATGSLSGQQLIHALHQRREALKRFITDVDGAVAKGTVVSWPRPKGGQPRLGLGQLLTYNAKVLRDEF